MDKTRLIDDLTELVMIDRHYDRSNPRDRLEWDAANEDSQYSLVREDVDFIVNAIDDAGLLKNRLKRLI